MTLHRGDVLAGRFEVVDDVDRFHRAQGWATRRWSRTPAERASHEDYLWLRGVDRETGASVFIEARSGLTRWIFDLEREFIARRVLAISSASTATVLHVGPGIVYAEPPPGLARGSLTPEEAAALTIEACAVVAALRANGVRPSCFDSRNLRVVRERGRLEIRWIVPGLPLLSALDALDRDSRPPPRPHKYFGWPDGSVQYDIRELSRFFDDLLAAPDQSPAVEALAAIASAAKEELPGNLASLARLLLAVAAPSPELEARVAAIPVADGWLIFPFDWSEVITEGEAALTDPSMREALEPYVTLPLGAAYHQRAIRSAASGALEEALRDADRAVALDVQFLPYITTRAVLLDRLGRGAEALPALDHALRPRLKPTDEDFDEVEQCEYSSDAELARAHGTRGMILLRSGAHTAAAQDLGHALELSPLAFYAHGLGAARYALGDFSGAAEAEARSVALEPSNTRYRWALVGSLRKLDRGDEARAESEAILALEPVVTSHRERFARLFGAAVEVD